MVEQTAETLFQRALACERAAIKASNQPGEYYWEAKRMTINLKRHWLNLAVFFYKEVDRLLDEAVKAV